MSEVTESSKSSSSDNEGFINYILTFKDDQKNEVMNIMQYCVLAIIPVMVILKSVKTIVPADDESKGCLEITINFKHALGRISNNRSPWFDGALEV